MRASASNIRKAHGFQHAGDVVAGIMERLAEGREIGPYGDAGRTAKVEALADVIAAALQETGSTEYERDHLLAAASRLITADGDLEDAIGCYFAEGTNPARTVLLAYKFALEEIADPMKRVRRLRADANLALEMAERHATTAAGHERTAAKRLQQGESDLARDQELMAAASRTCEERNRVRAAELAAQADQLGRELVAAASIRGAA